MKKTSPRARHLLSRLVLSLLALVILLPVAMTAVYSFFSPAEIKAFMGTRGSYDASVFMQIKLAPSMFSLSQYYNILIEDMTILRYFVNSAMYAAAILLGQALLIPAMAYALSRFRFPGRDAIFFVVIMLMLLPFQVTMVPNVLTLRQMGLLDTVWAVILPMTIAPFSIFLLRQYMVSLPGDMIEAAQIDGAGKMAQMRYVVLPGILSTVVIMLITRIGSLLNIGYEKVLLLYNPSTYVTADVVSTFAQRKGLEGGQKGLAAAAEMMNNVISMLLVISANTIARKASDTSLY